MSRSRSQIDECRLKDQFLSQLIIFHLCLRGVERIDDLKYRIQYKLLGSDTYCIFLNFKCNQTNEQIFNNPVETIEFS